MGPIASFFKNATGAVIAAGKDAIYSGAHLAGGSAAATLKIYHGSDASGPQIASLAAVAGAGDDDATKGGGIACPNGICAAISGTGLRR